MRDLERRVMEFLKFLLSIVSRRKNLEYFIESCQLSYSRHKESHPGHDPHMYLSMAWLAFTQAKGVNIEDDTIREAAVTTTLQVACIPEPDCARALGLFMAYRERRELFMKYPDLIDEFNRLYAPVIEAQEEDQLDELYRQLNPKGDFKL